MEKSIYFTFGIHNHQPVGNFESVFEYAYRKSYLPFIELLLKYPKIKVSLHYTGPLIDFLIEKHPDCFEKLKTLVERGQVEMLTGTYYEAILPNIPDRDKISQIQSLTRMVKLKTGYHPVGMWTAERVWEPQLARPMAEAGVKYTILDEAHFRYAGLPAEGIFGYYVCEEQGHTVATFPISYELRHLIPFAEPHKTLDFLYQNASPDGKRLAIFADDGEKFGVWPGTYKTAYEEKWLEKFFQLLQDNAHWIKMVTFSEYMELQPSISRIYLPGASYFEMTEWALPTPAGKDFQKVIRQVKNDGKWDFYQPFLRGGFWRNFLVKYPESNNMHKKALLISAKVARMPEGEEKHLAQQQLWMGQCNCAYWHGVFGGLYLSHLRTAIYQHLIKAEKIVDNHEFGGKPFVSETFLDFDGDGHPEVLMNTDTLSLYFAPDHGGALFELDYKPAAINFLDTMTRREEVYHDKIRELASQPDRQSDCNVSIHEMSRMKEGGLDKLLCYDWYRKIAMLDHFLHPQTQLEDFAFADYGEQGNFVQQPYHYKLTRNNQSLRLEMSRIGNVWVQDLFARINLKKIVELAQDRSEFLVEYQLENLENTGLPLWFAIEWNLGFLCADDSSYFLINEEKPKHSRFSDRVADSEVSRVTLVDGVRKVKISFEVTPGAALWRCPLYTISQSESGFEKTFQNAVLLFNWKLELAEGEKQNLQLKVSISPFEAVEQDLPQAMAA